MRRFREFNRPLVGIIGVVVALALIAAALEFPALPLIHSNAGFSADFANAGGLAAGDLVTIHGVKVGSITGMSLDGDHVTVSFEVNTGLKLGSATTAAAEVLSPVGTEYMQLTSAGAGSLRGTIPESRTSVPYNLVTDLSGLGSTIQGYNIPELEKSLEVGSQDLNGTSPAELTSAFDGLAHLSSEIGAQQTALATIVTSGAGLTGVLSQNSHQLFDLFGQANLVLQVLEERRTAIQGLLTATSTLSQQITSVLSVNRSQLTSLLQSLQAVSAVLAKDSNDFSQAIPVLAAFSRYSANSTGSGAFADVAVPTLLIPDNLAAQCSAKGAFPSSNGNVGCRP
ncbi:MAG TPA: MCE family protein [Acidimicrobiales bacterium]|jgi:phospholipid/cholesterol/gamma-HCH transport system substrate-binding protein|nr:MCE family protein [Acidimicrobiales bacterium]